MEISIPGRAGSAFTFLGTKDSLHKFFLGAGASRQDQYDDFYLIEISTTNESDIQIKKLNIKEMDGFGARHSIGTGSWEGKAVIFGG